MSPGGAKRSSSECSPKAPTRLLEGLQVISCGIADIESQVDLVLHFFLSHLRSCDLNSRFRDIYLFPVIRPDAMPSAQSLQVLNKLPSYIGSASMVRLSLGIEYELVIYEQIDETMPIC